MVVPLPGCASNLTAGIDIPFVWNCCWKKEMPLDLVFSLADDVPLNVAMSGDLNAVGVLLEADGSALMQINLCLGSLRCQLSSEKSLVLNAILFYH